MTCSSLRVEVQDPYILVDMRGPVSGRNFANKKHLGLPWMRDPGASITFKEFRILAWEAANERARELTWISCDELHEAVRRAGAT